MNLHVPQSIEAEVDIMVNSKCSKHIVSAQGSRPINGIVQDGLVASYILTMTWDDGKPTMISRDTALRIYEECDINKSRVNDLLSRARVYYPDYINKSSKIKPCVFNDYIPGALFVSALFPPNFCYEKTTGVHDDPKRSKVVIINGVLQPFSAPLCKKTVGSSGRSIVHDLWKLNSEYALKFLSELQQLTDRWLPTHGFTMGISDCFAETSEGVAKTLIKTRSKVSNVLKNAETAQKAEVDVNGVLNDAMAVGPILAKGSMKKLNRNALNIMRNSGAKGSVINLAQIVAFVGQQNIRGERMPMTLSNNQRCLPSFLPGDTSPDARGFVEDNYITGLTPQAAFFHAAAGRDGIISTALKTADTGYVQKRLARKMEDCKICIDGTVRNANGSVINFLYGGDGMDSKKLVSVKDYDYPFFIDPNVVASRLNSDAVRNGVVKSRDKPRVLREEEMNCLIKNISYSKSKTNVIKQANENVRSMLRQVVKDTKIYECKIPDFIVEIRDAYVNSKIQYGTMIGLIATSSIGEPTTQMVLNVFHLAGIKGKGASSGVPRFKELINVTKSADQRNPGCVIYFNNPKIKENALMIKNTEERNKNFKISVKERAKNDSLIKECKKSSLSIVQGFRKNFEEIIVKNLLKHHEMKYIKCSINSPTGLITYKKYQEPWWSKLSKNMHNIDIPDTNWVLILQFDMKKLFDNRIELGDIVNAIEEHSDLNIKCVKSPNNIGIIEIYSNTDETKDYAKSKINFGEYPLTDDNIEYFICRDVTLSFILNVQISGIKNITKTYPREDIKTNEWVMDTDGINFLKILEMPCVDKTRTIVDDIHSINSVLGIEAARRFLFKELMRVISFDGTYINPRHFTTLVDVMTSSGSLTAASRYGIGRDAGPNAKIMFEKPVDNAMKACVFGEVDKMTSLSSSVMYGKLAKAGSGVVTVRKEDSRPVSSIPDITDASQISKRIK